MGRFVALGTGAVGSADTDASAALPWLVANWFPPRADAAHPDEWRDEPVEQWAGPADDDELVRRLLAIRPSAAQAFGNRVGFRELWEGDADALARAYPDSGMRTYDASAADAALAAHLCWATGNHHERIERLMQRSALAREKWEARPEYLQQTITWAAARTTRWMADRPATVAPALAAPAGGGLSFAAAAGGHLPAALPVLLDALRSEEAGVTVAYDRFSDEICIRRAGDAGWRPVRDVDVTHMRDEFERRGFKAIPAQMMKDAIEALADTQSFDSAQDWGNAQVWDGVPRVAGSMARYFGTADDEYTKSVGAYLFTALAARMMDPGCQVDMAVILVDRRQGTRKSSALAELAPVPDAFGSVDLSKIDHSDTARAMRGKLVVELDELRGLAGKDQETVKSWITRRRESWTPKYKERAVSMPRRCVLVGSSNRDDILDDATGNRRMLPMHSGHTDDAALRRDCAQLWAEGIALWRAGGVAWQQAERLAVDQHEAFRRIDEWEGAVAEWLAAVPPAGIGEAPGVTPRGEMSFALLELMQGAVGVAKGQADRMAQRRVVDILQRQGYERFDAWVPSPGGKGHSVKRWRRASRRAAT